jgi:hypothetical protein
MNEAHSLAEEAGVLRNLAERHPDDIGLLQGDLQDVQRRLDDLESQLDDAAHAAEHGLKPVVTRDADSFYAKDPTTGELVAMLKMDREGYMELGVYTDEAQSTLRGGQALNALREAALEAGVEIRGMRGLWYKGSNLDGINAGIRAGMTPEEAALDKTFTGAMAKKYGYSRVRVDYENSVRNPDGTFQQAFVWFD